MRSQMFRELLYNYSVPARRNAIGKLADLFSYEKYDSDECIGLQNKLLKNLLLHAHSEVPYYREILSKAGVVDANGVNLYRFQSIPILTKVEIRQWFDELQSNDLNERKWYKNTSGGSTGEPICFIQDQIFYEWDYALKCLYDLRTKYQVGLPKAILWGSDREIIEGAATFRTRFGRWLRNETWLNSYCMTSSLKHEYAEKLNMVKPAQILAFAESIFEFSRFIEKELIDIYSPAAIMTTAGTLHPNMRQHVEYFFRTRIFDRYGSKEVGNIACECESHNGLHISLPTHFVEIVDKHGEAVRAGEVGEIIVTCLVNYAMPLIRYKIGDLGIKSEWKCRCGRAWPLLQEISGRSTDFFIRPDGTEVNGIYFNKLFYFQEWVEKFQVVQETMDSIQINIKPRDPGRDVYIRQLKEISEINQKIRSAMGENCQIRYNFVSEIVPSRSGKHRYVISKIGESTSFAKESVPR